MADGILKRLEALLAVERAAVLEADYGVLAELAPKKARLIERLEAAGLDGEALAQAGAGLRRNQTLLAAALAGLREASGRSEARRAVAASFSTYDRTGALSTVRGAAAGSGLEKKA